MNVAVETWEMARKGRRRIVGAMVRAGIRACGGACGPGLTVGRGVVFRRAPGCGWQVGANVEIGPGVVFDVRRGGVLRIGDNVQLSSGITIGVGEKVEIGDGCLVAEYVSIRDEAHGTEPSRPIKDQAMTAEPVVIGCDVWIGRGVCILKGVTVGDGAVVAANSVVRDDVPPKAVAAGAPATVRNYR